MSEIRNMVVVDTETTGTDVKSDGICQISAVLVRFDGRDLVGKPTTLVNTRCRPHVAIPEEASKIHGTWNQDVIFATPQKWALMQLDMVLQTLGGQEELILAGHNSEGFDCRLMDRLFPGGQFGAYRHVDTMIAARRLFPEGRHKLGELYEDLLGKNPEGAHDAAFDCHMVAELIIHMMQAEIFPVTGGIDDVATWLAEPTPYQIFPFGKHRGTPIEKMPKSYIRWMKRTWERKDRDVQATINAVLSRQEAASG